MAAVRHIVLVAFLAGIGAPVLAAGTDAPARPEPEITYLGVETRMLDAELVDLRVALKGGETEATVTAYLKCAAAQYTLIRGMDT
ncbi:MAG TPA: hypothetical protein VGC31_00170, partial [Paenirhodobacter sp.]